MPAWCKVPTTFGPDMVPIATDEADTPTSSKLTLWLVLVGILVVQEVALFQ